MGVPFCDNLRLPETSKDFEIDVIPAELRNFAGMQSTVLSLSYEGLGPSAVTKLSWDDGILKFPKLFNLSSGKATAFNHPRKTKCHGNILERTAFAAKWVKHQSHQTLC
jgi:hypothetical protein